MKLRPVAVGLPWVGLSFVAWLGWALVTRLSRWAAAPFVLLVYGIMGCAVAAHVIEWLGRRRGEAASPAVVRVARILLSLVALVLALWVWCPLVMQPIVGYTMRAVSTWKFR